MLLFKFQSDKPGPVDSSVELNLNEVPPLQTPPDLSTPNCVSVENNSSSIGPIESDIFVLMDNLKDVVCHSEDLENIECVAGQMNSASLLESSVPTAEVPEAVVTEAVLPTAEVTLAAVGSVADESKNHFSDSDDDEIESDGESVSYFFICCEMM